MTLSTGSNSFFFARPRAAKKGFSFIEVIATIAVFSTGIVFIFKAFLLSLDYSERLACRAYALNSLNNIIAQNQEGLRAKKEAFQPIGQEVKSLKIGGKNVAFHFDLSIGQGEVFGEASPLDIKVSWRKGSHDSVLSRSVIFSSL